MAGECALYLLPSNCPSNVLEILKCLYVMQLKNMCYMQWVYANKNVPLFLNNDAYLCIFCQTCAKINRLQQELSAVVAEAEFKIEQPVRILG